ncbi:hypothetical protein RQP54_14010 [Curvibacter sp. APW13]|uniref:hypothetical protein n=1 Tax=Curvibacter sp. APW13 TaxID=3077236 RepID=UPI0028DD61E9|nr:hypothetical protein [Curvibacter sp. APW13]MDT8991982.1 hypothetical protein [Curvibacter sp. APW13]
MAPDSSVDVFSAPAMADALPSPTVQAAVAAGVRLTMRTHFPHNFYSLCHAYAVLGSNVASIATGREYRPVAGHAAFDAGHEVIAMDEERAFGNGQGGAYHCWIESHGHTPRELVDLTFGNNHHYAIANGFSWRGPRPPEYLWGTFDRLTVDLPRQQLVPGFGQDRIWLQETTSGALWMEDHINANANAYLRLTTLALCHYRDRMEAAGHTAPLPA